VIKCHFVCDEKHDGHHKARFAAEGHMTSPSAESVYSGVVSLRTVRLALLIAELKGLETMMAYVGSAYPEAVTSKKFCFKAGLEFGELERFCLIIYKAMYGLRTSGAEWHMTAVPK
jgi:hypothetical protein